MSDAGVIPPKALILGIDGGSLDVIEPLLAQGLLPNLGTLLGVSLHGATTTTWPAHTAPGWTTFVTARQPGGHGIYQFFDTQHPEYGDRIVGSGDFGCSTVWEWLARQGLSVGLVNVPMSHPPIDVPGYQVTWPLVQTLRYSRPSGLLGELSAAGAPFTSDLLTMYQGDLGYADFAVANVHARSRSIRHLLTTRPVDVVMAVLTEVDRVCHHYWHFADPCHPRHDHAPRDDDWAQAIRRTYAAVDEMVGEVLELVGDETTVVVVSDHGFGQGRQHVGVNTVLAEAGLLATRSAANPYASWFSAEGRTVDFARTAAYMPTPGSYAINFNLDGRQREGRVTQRDLPALTEEISGIFAGLTDPQSGRRTFAAVLPRAEAYPGAMGHAAPDLLLVPADQGVLADPSIGGDVWRSSYQSGMHRYSGMWAIRSPRVTPGRHPDPVALHDVIPTLLHDLGLRQPGSVAGRPIPAVTAQHPDVQPYLPDVASVRTPGDPDPRRVRDDDLTAKALAAMGYL
ncbi:alkaline phosphatase family protein [Micromonospora sp. NPDC050397]|uniref:alkaline phosphatase family protein n=1 Tax=Micromonospora sp. NPDC050397 TaxID=3364279 RepID=UPI00384E3FB3